MAPFIQVIGYRLEVRVAETSFFLKPSTSNLQPLVTERNA